MKTWMLAVSGLMLMACGAVPSDDQVPSTDALGAVEQSITLCGVNYDCGTGAYVYQFDRVSSCSPTSPGVANSRVCVSIPTAADFLACGLGVDSIEASNHYIDSYDFKDLCAEYYTTVQGSSDNNRTRYNRLPTSGSYIVCGTACPAGSGGTTFYKSSCRLNPTTSSTTAHNAIVCTI